MNVFTRSLTDDLASLVKQVDALVGDNKNAKSFIVLLSKDPDGDEAKIKEFAKKNGIKNVPLTIFDGEAGPGGYKISKDADVTVLLWKGQTVKTNHAYKTGGLNKDTVSQVVADAKKLLN